jgi:hypothetical protein
VLKNPAVAAEIEWRTAARIRKLEIKADGVLQELGCLAFANMQDYITVQEDGSAYVNLTGLSREQMAAISELTIEEYTEGRGEEKRNVRRTKFKLSDKGTNLERLGRHFKLFVDKSSPMFPAGSFRIQLCFLQCATECYSYACFGRATGRSPTPNWQQRPTGTSTTTDESVRAPCGFQALFRSARFPLGSGRSSKASSLTQGEQAA